MTNDKAGKFAGFDHTRKVGPGTPLPGPDPLPRVELGALSVTVLSDGHLDLPAAAFSEVPADTPDPLRFAANLWLVEAGSRRVLIDTGAGALLHDRFPAAGALLQQVERHRINTTTITDVILTHMHPDHVGGLMADGAALLPGVPVHVSRAEWAHWTDPALPDRVPADRRAGVEAVQTIAESYRDSAVLHDGAADLGDGISLVPAPGHTPGHLAVRLTSQGKELLVLGDAILWPMQVAAPGITYALDADPEQAVATRRALLADLARRGTLCAATHFPAPGLGHIRAEGDGFRFEPL